MVTDRMDPLALQGAKQGRRGHARHPLCPAGYAAGRSAGAGERSYYGPSGRASGQNVTRPRRDGVRALMAIVGYARVSTLDQVLDSQVDEITASGATRIFTDKASGKLDARPGLAAALDYLRDHEGRQPCGHRIDRLGRSVQHLVRVVDDLKARGIEFRSLHEGIDTPPPAARLSS